MLDYSKLHARKKAIFNPKNPNIRPYLADHVGRAFTFQCTDYGHEGDPYPGQYRWFALADDQAPAGREWGPLHPEFHHWVPDEDLIDLP